MADTSTPCSSRNSTTDLSDTRRKSTRFNTRIVGAYFEAWRKKRNVGSTSRILGSIGTTTRWDDRMTLSVASSRRPGESITTTSAVTSLDMEIGRASCREREANTVQD